MLYRGLSGVLSIFVNLYLLNNVQSDNLALTKANLAPMQNLGPPPKGMNVKGFILPLFSGMNLSG